MSIAGKTDAARACRTSIVILYDGCNCNGDIRKKKKDYGGLCIYNAVYCCSFIIIVFRLADMVQLVGTFIV